LQPIVLVAVQQLTTKVSCTAEKREKTMNSQKTENEATDVENQEHSRVNLTDLLAAF